jgi:putative membrane protein insertion efficiency factor
MSSLRKLAASLYRYVLIGSMLAALVLFDSIRPPSDQITVKVLIAGIRAYQKTCVPIVSRWVCCRYRPTCSHYCIQALQRHGIGKGTRLCVRRLLSCTKEVPPGTPDPVPR